jgi:hypothetical protein
MRVVKMLCGVHATITKPREDGDEIEPEQSGSPLWFAAMAVSDGDDDDKGDGEGEKTGALELATLLVEEGADVDKVGSYGGGESTPLWWAAQAVYYGRAGALELAKLLVEKGAKVDVVGVSGEYESTPLWWAAVAVYYGRAGRRSRRTRRPSGRLSSRAAWVPRCGGQRVRYGTTRTALLKGCWFCYPTGKISRTTSWRSIRNTWTPFTRSGRFPDTNATKTSNCSPWRRKPWSVRYARRQYPEAPSLWSLAFAFTSSASGATLATC